MTQIQAIQTRYKGYHFRSRLEARWAVFFDALGLQWEYEPEGFELPDGTWYLPDFRVTSHQGSITWYEVKPNLVARDEQFSKFFECVTYWGKSMTEEDPIYVSAELLNGDPFDIAKPAKVCPRCGTVSKSGPANGWNAESDLSFSYGCEPCDFNTLGGGGHPYEQGLTVAVKPHKGFLLNESMGAWAIHARKITAAAHAARSARFEHGQSGAS